MLTDEPLSVQKSRVREQMARVILKCWQDPEFKKELMSNPARILQSEGVTINPDIEYVIVCDEHPKLHFIIPEPPVATPLSADDMLQLALAGTQLILPSIIC